MVRIIIILVVETICDDGSDNANKNGVDDNDVDNSKGDDINDGN